MKRTLVVPLCFVCIIAAFGVWRVFFSVEEGKQIAQDTRENVAEDVPDIPADLDTVGWSQSAGPLGGTIIRMVPHGETLWASLYSGGIYELQKNDSWRQIAVGHGIPEVRAFDIVEDPHDEHIAYVLASEFQSFHKPPPVEAEGFNWRWFSVVMHTSDAKYVQSTRTRS